MKEKGEVNLYTKLSLMEEYDINNPVVATHLLQHTLRNLCHENSLWIYAVFWRIIPRNHPPPDRDFLQRGAPNRSRVNRRNWMLAWEDGFCNFFASTAESNSQAISSSADYNCDIQVNGLRPELFFKMSHEIHNYGEGLIGKVAADRGHRCVYSEHINLSMWPNSGDLHPRTWNAQFQSGIKTIALIAVDEGVLQLGAVRKVPDDLLYVSQLQNKFNNLQIIPGFLLPRPSSPIHSSFPLPLGTTPFIIHNSFKIKGFHDSINVANNQYSEPNPHPLYSSTPLTSNMDDSYHFNQPLMRSLLSTNSLENLLLKLPSVSPASSPPLFHQLHDESQPWFPSYQKAPLIGMEEVANSHQSNYEEKKHGMYLRADIN